jgi:uncharacterized membrane protein
MMKSIKSMPWWGWATWILVLILGTVASFHLPSQIPTHYDLAGKPNHYGSKWVDLLIEPAVTFVVILLWHVLWRIDPRKRNYETFWPTYRYIGGVVVVSLSLVYLAILGHALNMASMRIIPTVYGIMFMLIANVTPRLQPNWWVGIRTPWTLSSEVSWRKSHRLAGRLGIPMGILIVILAWALPIKLAIVVAILVPILLWVLIVVVASYVYAKKDV